MLLACPYVSETDLRDAGDCPILILACDGVWDTLSDQDAADLLMERYLTEGIFTDAAECLVRTSPFQSLISYLIRLMVNRFTQR